MTIDELEKAARTLSREERDRLIAYLEELHAAEFDAKIERDAESGKLDKLAERALAEFRAGRYREI